MIPILKNIPNVKPNRPTILEIAGYPHYENVVSNLLAFYLDFNEEHGLGDIVFKSLHELIFVEETYSLPKSIEVVREVGVRNGRIDILIITDELVIVIENKIFHKLDNPLDAYQTYAENLQKEEKKSRKGVILSLNPEFESGFFRNILYSQLFKRIKKNDKNNLTNSGEFYPEYFKQLMITIERLKEKTEMKEQELSYLINNKEDVKKLNNLITKYFSDIRKKLNQIKEILEIEKHVESSRIWIDKEVKAKLEGVALYNLKRLNNANSIELKIRISPNGWTIELWNTRLISEKNRDLLKNTSKSEFKYNKQNQQFIEIYTQSYSTPNRTIKELVEKTLNELYNS